MGKRRSKQRKTSLFYEENTKFDTNMMFLIESNQKQREKKD